MDIQKFESIDFVKENMTSMDLANAVNKRHADVLRDLRQMADAWEKVTERKLTLSNYKDSSGKILPLYILNKADILYYLSKYDDKLMIDICKSISNNTPLKNFNIEKHISKRKEDKFYNEVLLKIFEKAEIIRQYKIDKYRIDFYLPKHNLAIEFDEKHHRSNTNKLKDNDRELFIKSKLNCNFIRVDELELTQKRMMQSQLDYFWDKEDQLDLYKRKK